MMFLLTAGTDWMNIQLHKYAMKGISSLFSCLVDMQVLVRNVQQTDAHSVGKQ